MKIQSADQRVCPRTDLASRVGRLNVQTNQFRIVGAKFRSNIIVKTASLKVYSQ